MRMFKFNNIGMIAAVVMASAGFLVSCVELETEQPLADAVGYLVAPSLEVDVTVDDLQLTKTLDFTVEQPSVSDIRFVVKDKDNNVRYEGNGLWNEPLVLPVGSYTIEATAGSNTYGAPYFTGTASGTVEALDREVPQLEMSLANSLLRVTVSDELKTHFTPDATVVLGDGAHTATYGEWFYAPSGSDISLSLSGKSSTDGDVTFNYTLQSPSPKVAYNVVCGKETTDWPSVTMSAISSENAWASRVYVTTAPTFTGNISEANKAMVVYEASSDGWATTVTSVSESGVQVLKGLTPGTKYQVRAKVGALVSSNSVEVTPSVDGLSASAVHTFTNNELDGTDVTPVFSKSDYIKNAITSWEVNICKADGTKLRRQTSIGASDGSAITATNGWPYLPVGAGQSYKITASAVMDGTTYTFEDQNVSFANRIPSFTVTAHAETSYSRYQNYLSGVSGYTLGLANASGTGDKVMNIRGSVTITDNILGNSNYAALISASLTYDGLNMMTSPAVTSNVFYPNTLQNNEGLFVEDGYMIISQALAQHSVNALFTFDGTSASNTLPCHVTGIPYSVDCSNTSSISGWTCSNTGESYGKLCIEEGDGYLHSNQGLFYVPEDYNVTINVPAHGYHSNALTLYEYTPNVYIGPTNSAGKIGSATTAKVNINPGTYEDSNYTDVTRIFTLTTEVSRICIYGENTKRGSDTRQIRLRNININYAQ